MEGNRPIYHACVIFFPAPRLPQLQKLTEIRHIIVCFPESGVSLHQAAQIVSQAGNRGKRKGKITQCHIALQILPDKIPICTPVSQKNKQTIQQHFSKIQTGCLRFHPILSCHGIPGNPPEPFPHGINADIFPFPDSPGLICYII